jgi:hemerythrin-like domain-containing protein
MQTLRVLRGEHRAAAAVLARLQHLLADIQSGCATPNLPLIGEMIYYIDTFAARFHHPKEDGYLFRRLRERCPIARDLLDRLDAEHKTARSSVAQLGQAFARYYSGGEVEFHGFAAVVDAYCAFEWRHMSTEETQLLPLAERYLTRDDWAAIDAVLLDPHDPIFGETAEKGFRQRFERIIEATSQRLAVGATMTTASRLAPVFPAGAVAQ